MLRTQVRLGRSVHHSDLTHEYAVTLDGEIPFPPEDAEGVLEKVAELFHLADEALNREIEKGDEQRPTLQQASVPQTTKPVNTEPVSPSSAASRVNAITSKQLQFLQSLAKRKGLARDDLDGVITQLVGSTKKLGDLTKKEAGQIIDHLNHLNPEAT